MRFLARRQGFNKKRPVRFAAKLNPHRPSIASALGLRADGCSLAIVTQTVAHGRALCKALPGLMQECPHDQVSVTGDSYPLPGFAGPGRLRL
jgi:hypothetical protein